MNSLNRLVGYEPTDNSTYQRLIVTNDQEIETGFFYPIHESCVEKVKRLSLKAIFIGQTAGVAIGTTYLTYNNIMDIIVYGASSPLGIISIVFLSIEFSCICAGSLCLIKVRHYFPLLRHYKQKALDYASLIDNDKTCLPIIQKCFEKMKEQEFFSTWLKIKNYENSAKAINLMWNDLKSGVCAGHALDLLTQMIKHSNDKSVDLIKRMDIEKVIYFQILENIFSSLLRKRRKYDFESFLLSLSIREGDILAVNNKLALHLQQYNSDDINIINKQIIVDIDKGADVIKEKFLKCVVFIGSKDKVLAGTIGLLPKNTEDIKGHVLFFQCGGGFYRYYDSSSTMPGFFEFRDINTFFDTLVKHVKKWGTRWGTDGEKWGTLGFRVHGISKKEKLDSKE